MKRGLLREGVNQGKVVRYGNDEQSDSYLEGVIRVFVWNVEGRRETREGSDWE